MRLAGLLLPVGQVLEQREVPALPERQGTLASEVTARTFVPAHFRGQAAEHLGIGQRLAQRGDGRLVEHHVQVPVGLVHVEVLELGRRRQHEVGEVGGIRLELFEHDGEEVFAGEAARNLA